MPEPLTKSTWSLHVNNANNKRQITITLDPEVLKYVEERALNEARTRSQAINFMLREEAKRNGKISPPNSQPAQVPLA
jgi:hypothetical protein